MKTFKQYLLESSLKDLEVYAKNLGIIFFTYEHNNDIILDSIIVPKEMQKEGVGTDILEKLVKVADKEGKRLLVSPGQKDDRHGTTSRNRLIKFYKRFGFIMNKGRNKDFEISQLMYRDPK